MPYAIEIRFDESSETQLREIWRSAAVFYSTECLFSNRVIPHISLVVSDGDLGGVFGVLAPLSIKVRLSGTGFFLDGDIAYLKAEPDPEVLSYHLGVVSACDALGLAVSNHYRPGEWVPHCTLAQHCATNRALPLQDVDMVVGVGSLMLVEYPPTRILAETCIEPPSESSVGPLACPGSKL